LDARDRALAAGPPAHPEGLEVRLDWQPDQAHPPFVIELASYFTEVIGGQRRPRRAVTPESPLPPARDPRGS